MLEIVSHENHFMSVKDTSCFFFQSSKSQDTESNPRKPPQHQMSIISVLNDTDVHQH